MDLVAIICSADFLQNVQKLFKNFYLNFHQKVKAEFYQNIL